MFLVASSTLSARPLAVVGAHTVMIACVANWWFGISITEAAYFLFNVSVLSEVCTVRVQCMLALT